MHLLATLFLQVLIRKNVRNQLFHLYVAQMKADGGGEDHYRRSMFYKFLGGKIFGDRKGQQAACDTCVDYIVHTFQEIKVDNIRVTISLTVVIILLPLLL
jgi:hypothetical protein